MYGRITQVFVLSAFLSVSYILHRNDVICVNENVFLLLSSRLVSTCMRIRFTLKVYVVSKFLKCFLMLF